MRQPSVLVYMMTGFLDSGKTQFLRFTLAQEYFQISGKTLLLLCEEGENEYDGAELKKHRVVLERIEKQEELTTELLERLDRTYCPERVVVEYNGMWKVSDFERLKLPQSWEMEQKITTVDASTFQMYLTNLKPLFVEMVRGSEMVLFNRCKDLKPLAGYRRSVKVVNPQAEVIFEGDEGEIENIFADEMPYDLSRPVVEIPPEDYGIWFVDAGENHDRYRGKVVEFTAMAKKFPNFPSGVFLPGRMAMTCCADDMTFLGYVCKCGDLDEPRDGEWVRIRARVDYARLTVYHGVGPVLRAERITPAQEIKELVFFN